MAGLLVVMGSGETAPTMVKPHRSIFERVGDRPAVLLDTPYGFQSNADDISTRAVGYFAASVGPQGRRGVVARRRRRPAWPGSGRSRLLDAAGWIFAGPGLARPTRCGTGADTPVEAALVDVLARDGVVVLASAAALTLGSHTVPVYEIYKAGVDPRWEPGLDLVRQVTGLPAVVIPHYDNAEGGHHDTRFCYLGEDRLSTMETELPDERVRARGGRAHRRAARPGRARRPPWSATARMTIRRAGPQRHLPGRHGAGLRRDPRRGRRAGCRGRAGRPRRDRGGAAGRARTRERAA